MKIEFTIEEPSRIDVVIERDAFTGKFTLTANGVVHVVRSALSPSTHINITLKKSYDIDVDGHTINILHTRPLLMAGLRPQEYNVSVDGNQVAYYKGY